jgi:multimeric flavodoxin WrbA
MSFPAKTLLIIYHSMTGGTRQMAAAAAAGARTEPALNVRLVDAGDATAQDLLGADGFVFATPENLAAISGRLKEFFDRTYYAVLDRLDGRPYAVLVCAGSDGRSAARQIERIATGWRLRAIGEPLIVCTQAQTPEAILREKTLGMADLGRCTELGARFGAGMALGIF